MVSTTGLPSGAALATAKKAAAKAAAVKKPRAKPTHPRTSDMVDAAIKALKERGGSSLQAIKKYIAATYSVDAEKLAPFIKKYLKSGVVAKKLVQTKGKGASGSFKLSLGEAGAKKPAVAVKKIARKPAVKKPAAPKKSPAKKAAAAPAKKAAPKKKSLKTLAAKPPKPKAAKPAKKAKPTGARKPVAKRTVAKKAPAKK